MYRCRFDIRSIGIGAAIAKHAAKAGASVVLFARSEDKLASLANEIHDLAGDTIQVFCTVVDVRDFDQLDTGIKIVVKQSGPIDVLVNNAGLALSASAAFPQLAIKDIVQMAETNIQGKTCRLVMLVNYWQ